MPILSLNAQMHAVSTLVRLLRRDEAAQLGAGEMRPCMALHRTLGIV
jgi:hypothetical protein